MDRELLELVQKKAGRAMTRLNKLRAGSNIRQQQLLAETRDLIAEILDEVQAAEEALDDQPQPQRKRPSSVASLTRVVRSV